MSLPRRRFRDLTTYEVDAWVERDHERQLARYERKQEIADALRDELQEHEIRELDQDGE